MSTAGFRGVGSGVRGAGLLLTLALVAVNPGPWSLTPVLSAQTSTVRQQRAELDRIRQEREALERQMRDLQTTVHTVEATVRNLDRRTDATSRLVRGLDRQLMLISAEVIEANDNMARAEAELTRKRIILRRRLVDIYKRGGLYHVEVMLASQSFGELVARYKYLHLLALRDRAVVHQVEQLRNTVAIERDRLVRLQQNINDTRLERQREANQLKTLTAEQRATLARTRRLQHQTEIRLARARQTENQLSNAIAAFEAERRRTEAARPAARRTASTVRTSDYGKLDWPVEGPLVYTFGREVQPNNTSIKWNGVGIRAATGTPVKSVAAGRIVSVRQLGTYGLTVILEHGGGDYTIYGSLASAAVKVGQTVAKGARIGEVGMSDPELPPHLHFEVRQGGPAVDPANWLRRR
jgi:septal ring factor EnvC (AmiA/AmiB activator)